MQTVEKYNEELGVFSTIFSIFKRTYTMHGRNSRYIFGKIILWKILKFTIDRHIKIVYAICYLISNMLLENKMFSIIDRIK